MEDPSGGGHDFSQDISGVQGIVCSRCGVFLGSGAIAHGGDTKVYRWTNLKVSGAWEPCLPCDLEVVYRVMES